MTNYENLINLPLNFNANNHANNIENNGKIAIGEHILNKMSQRDFSEVSPGIAVELRNLNGNGKLKMIDFKAVFICSLLEHKFGIYKHIYIVFL
ncbi:GH12732 [Drosophila grimshawi]|uniref:GH12732 n=1 Tax=Drosophila grimshawi TaxID=7222 RepID=B4JKU2_DROGR|nr:GH12732 [Drosophila grimshawi]